MKQPSCNRAILAEDTHRNKLYRPIILANKEVERLNFRTTLTQIKEFDDFARRARVSA
jgi:hypothetical protein